MQRSIALCVLALEFLLTGPVSSQRIPRWTLVESKVIGDLDRRDYALSRVEGIVSSDSGHVFVLQHTESVIKEYDARGQFVRRIGRPGMGPGEFVTPVLIWWQNSGLVVMDDGSSRISRFTKDGRFQTSVQLKPLGGGLPLPITASADGSMVAYERRLASDFQSGRTLTPLMWIHGGRADTLTILNLAGLFTPITANQGKRVIVPRNLFTDHDLVVSQTDRRRVVVMNRKRTKPGAPTLTWIGLSGDTLAKLTLALDPIPVSATVKDSVLNYFAERVMQMGAATTAAGGRDHVSKQLTIPTTWPLATDMLGASDGNLWIRRAPRGGVVEWIVLSADGRHIADVVVPGALRVLSVTGTEIWGVRTDAMEIPYVVSYKIVKGRT